MKKVILLCLLIVNSLHAQEIIFSDFDLAKLPGTKNCIDERHVFGSVLELERVISESFQSEESSGHRASNFLA